MKRSIICDGSGHLPSEGGGMNASLCGSIVGEPRYKKCIVRDEGSL
jgi:hypothetical protein